jgi:hypothetical protein
MVGGWDSAIWGPVIADQLGIEETAEPVLPAIAPNSDPGTAFGLAFAMPMLWVTRRLSRQRRDRRVLAQSGFPLAQRMVLAVTKDRLLVWSANRRWKPMSFLGALSRERIVRADAPTVGEGWRTVRIEVQDAEPIVIKVAAKYADPLAAVLSAR